MRHHDSSVVGSHSLGGDAPEIAELGGVDVARQSGVEREQPPPLWQPEGEVGALLWERPAPKPAPAEDEGVVCLEAVDPI